MNGQDLPSKVEGAFIAMVRDLDDIFDKLPPPRPPSTVSDRSEVDYEGYLSRRRKGL